MFKIIPVALFFLSFFASLISNAILRRLSIKYDFLLDKPNLIRKFHKKITPATGGIAISFGIIFSGLFLYAFDDTSQNFNIPSSSSIFGNQLQNTDINNVYEMDLAEGINIKIQRIDDNSFMIIMPSGEKVKIKDIIIYKTKLSSAKAGQSVQIFDIKVVNPKNPSYKFKKISPVICQLVN